MMKTEGDYLIFSSGRRAYANCGVVGLGPDLSPREGWDGGIDWPRYEDDPVGPEDLTAADMRELADHMILRWKLFKESLTDVATVGELVEAQTPVAGVEE